MLLTFKLGQSALPHSGVNSRKGENLLDVHLELVLGEDLVVATDRPGLGAERWEAHLVVGGAGVGGGTSVVNGVVAPGERIVTPDGGAERECVSDSCQVVGLRRVIEDLAFGVGLLNEGFAGLE